MSQPANIRGEVLAQAALPATTLTDVFTVPDGMFAFVTVTFCNQNAVTADVRLAVAVDGESDSAKQYLLYDATVDANGSYVWGSFPEDGIPMNGTDVLRAYSSSSNVSVNVIGWTTR